MLHVRRYSKTLKDMYVVNYRIINNMNSLYYSAMEVPIEFINSVIHFTFFLINSIFFFSQKLLEFA